MPARELERRIAALEQKQTPGVVVGVWFVVTAEDDERSRREIEEFRAAHPRALAIVVR